MEIFCGFPGTPFGTHPFLRPSLFGTPAPGNCSTFKCTKHKNLESITFKCTKHKNPENCSTLKCTEHKHPGNCSAQSTKILEIAALSSAPSRVRFTVRKGSAELRAESWNLKDKCTITFRQKITSMCVLEFNYSYVTSKMMSSIVFEYVMSSFILQGYILKIPGQHTHT